MNTRQDSRLLTLQAVTFLHPGTGQTTGVVDLPVQREVHTGYPMIAGSGLKGCLRDKAERDLKDSGKIEDVDLIFGSADATLSGALAVTDARILAFPVRSLQKVYILVTCPMVLGRLARDAKLARLPMSDLPEKFELPNGAALATTDGGLRSPLVLEEISLTVNADTPTDDVAKLITTMAGLGDNDAKDLASRLVILSDEDFGHFVRHGTQISARIALNERKTTTGDGGNLWYEETLPPETLMYALLLAAPPRSKEPPDHLKTASGIMDSVCGLLRGTFLQVGGNETVGQGWCRANLSGGTS